jgi:hypothetical protein
MSKPRTMSQTIGFRLPLTTYQALEEVASPGSVSQWVKNHLVELLKSPKSEQDVDITVLVNGVPIVASRGSYEVYPAISKEKSGKRREPLEPLVQDAAASVRLDGETRSGLDPAVHGSMARSQAARRAETGSEGCEHKKSVLITGGMRKCPSCGAVRRPDGRWYAA